MSAPRPTASFPGTPPRILHIAMEVEPWIRGATQASRVAGLASAQHRAGNRVTVVVPRHAAAVWPGWAIQVVEGARGELPLNGQAYPFDLARLRHPEGFEVVLVRAGQLFDRPGIPTEHRPWPEVALQSQVLASAALYYALHMGGRWDVLHGHGRSGVVALDLASGALAATPLQHARRVVTLGTDEAGGTWVQALQVAQGIHLPAPAGTSLASLLAEPDADLRTALLSRAPDVVRIPGGYEPAEADPDRNPALAAAFSPDDLGGREACRDDLLAIAGLHRGEGRPLVVTVALGALGPAAPSLIAETMAELLPEPVRLVLLGPCGGLDLQPLLGLAKKHKEAVAFFASPGDQLVYQALAGSDVLWLPHARELGDLLPWEALRLGALPVLRRGLICEDLPEGVPSVEHDDAALYSRALREAHMLCLDAGAIGRLRASAMVLRRPWSAVAPSILSDLYLR